MKTILSLLLICATTLVNAQLIDVVIDKMLLAINKVDRMSFDFKSKERYGDTYVTSEGSAKIVNQPKKIYFIQTQPDPVEILYNEEKNSKKALVKAKKLPVINLSIYSNKMRKRSHYPITQLGFQPIVNLFSNFKDLSVEKLYISNEKFQGRDCYQLEINFFDYELEIYKTTKEEYPRDIAEKRKINEHKIIELNGLSGYGKIKEGYYLTLPVFYATKIILIIDKKTNLPVQQTIYDELGLYEQYEYYNLKINPQFPSLSFPNDLK